MDMEPPATSSAHVAAPPSVGSAIDGALGEHERRLAAIQKKHDDTCEDMIRRDKKWRAKVGDLAHQLKDLDAGIKEKARVMARIEAQQNEALASMRRFNSKLATELATLKGIVGDVGTLYGGVHEEVSRQKELQVTMLEQHNDLRLTVHRQQPFIDTVIGAVADLSGGRSEPQPLAVRSASVSSNTFEATSPAANAYANGSMIVDRAKRAASERNSASYDTDPVDSHSARSDAVPASLKRRKAKQDLRGRHSSDSSILYEEHIRTEVAARLPRSRVKQPLESPATTRILQELKIGSDSAKAAIYRTREANDRAEKLIAPYKALRPAFDEVIEEAPVKREAEAQAQAPTATPTPTETMAATSGARRSTRETKKRLPANGAIDPRKLRPEQLSRPLTDEEIEAARP